MILSPTVVPLLDVLSSLYPGLSRSTLRHWLKLGWVKVNGDVVKIAQWPVSPLDRIQVVRMKDGSLVCFPFPIIYEDSDLIVVHKPAGLLTSTHAREKRPTLLAWVREYVNQKIPGTRVGLIHRLDRDASGLILFSLNNRSYASLKHQFYHHSAQRVYYALIDGTLAPPDGTIDYRLVEYADGTVHRTRRADRGESAVTRYSTIRSLNGRTLLRLELETGRKHQIRAHLTEKGHPIVGDRLYGGSPASRLMLAGVELKIIHPRTGKPVHFRVDLPEEMAKLMRKPG